MELRKGLIDFSRDNAKTVIFRDMIIDTTEANNTVQLKSGKIFHIKNISYTSDRCISFEGFETYNLSSLFEFPCKSDEVGVYKLGLE